MNIGKFCPLPLCTLIGNFRIYLYIISLGVLLSNWVCDNWVYRLPISLRSSAKPWFPTSSLALPASHNVDARFCQTFTRRSVHPNSSGFAVAKDYVFTNLTEAVATASTQITLMAFRQQESRRIPSTCPCCWLCQRYNLIRCLS